MSRPIAYNGEIADEYREEARKSLPVLWNSNQGIYLVNEAIKRGYMEADFAKLAKEKSDEALGIPSIYYQSFEDAFNAYLPDLLLIFRSRYKVYHGSQIVVGPIPIDAEDNQTKYRLWKDQTYESYLNRFITALQRQESTDTVLNNVRSDAVLIGLPETYGNVLASLVADEGETRFKALATPISSTLPPSDIKVSEPVEPPIQTQAHITSPGPTQEELYVRWTARYYEDYKQSMIEHLNVKDNTIGDVQANIRASSKDFGLSDFYANKNAEDVLKDAKTYVQEQAGIISAQIAVEERNKLQAEYDRLKAQAEIDRAARTKAETDAQSAKDAANKTQAEANAAIRAAQAQLDSANAAKTDLERQLNEAINRHDDAKITELQNQVKKASSDLDAAQAKVRQLQAQVDQGKKENKSGTQTPVAGAASTDSHGPVKASVLGIWYWLIGGVIVYALFRHKGVSA